MALFDDHELEAFYRSIEIASEISDEQRYRRRRGLGSSRIDPVIACPTPEKIAYPDYAAVTGAILAISRGSRTRPSLRSYECRCGYWHLTSGLPRER